MSDIYLPISILEAFLIFALLGVVGFQVYVQKRYKIAMRKMLDASNTGILIFDKKKELLHHNAVAAEYLEMIGDANKFDTVEKFIEFLFDHAVKGHDDIIERLQSRVFRTTPDFFEIVDFGDGVFHMVEMQTIIDKRTIVAIQDVSRLMDQSEAILALNKINERLSLAIEASSCGVFILDSKLRQLPMVFMNRAGREMSGLNPDNVEIGLMSFLEYLGISEDFSVIFDAIVNEESFRRSLQSKFEGVNCWYDFWLSPVNNDQGETELYVGVLNDITALKTREEEFFRAQKLDSLGQLSAGLAHDFNNILSIVEGYVRMIQANVEKPDKVLEYSNKIKDSSSRGAGLIKQMMAFARHKVKQDKVHDVKALLAEQEVLLRPLLKGDVELSVVSSEEDLYAYCDADGFVQILMNLVINANDALDNGGHVRVYLDVMPDNDLPDFITNQDVSYIKLSVRDDGSGMAPEVCERIFDPFYTTKAQGEGTGLGLSVVYGLVQDMDGYIDVRSELLVGTEFDVYIPRSDNAPKQVTYEGDEEDISNISFEGYTVLVAEDEEDLNGIIADILKRRGMNVLQAYSGNEALAIQDDYEGDVDVLLTDIVMPGISGIKLAGMMTALREDIGVIYMSGYPEKGQSVKSELPDGALFVPKPIDFDVLFLTLRNFLASNDK